MMEGVPFIWLLVGGHPPVLGATCPTHTQGRGLHKAMNNRREELLGGHPRVCLPVLLILQCTYKSPGDLVKCRFWFSKSGRALSVCISSKLPGDADADSLGTTKTL